MAPLDSFHHPKQTLVILFLKVKFDVKSLNHHVCLQNSETNCIELSIFTFFCVSEDGIY